MLSFKLLNSRVKILDMSLLLLIRLFHFDGDHT